MEVLNRYGMNITEGAYGDESANIRAVLMDLKAPALADARAAVPYLDTLIANLEGSEAAFRESREKLRDEGLERKASKSASVLARELRNLVNNEMCGYLAAMSQANPEKYEAFAKKFFATIEESNKKVIDRLAALKRKKEEAENK